MVWEKGDRGIRNLFRFLCFSRDPCFFRLRAQSVRRLAAVPGNPRESVAPSAKTSTLFRKPWAPAPMPAAAAKERKAPDSAGLGYSVSGRARPPSASVPRPGHLPRAAQNNWEEALAGCGGWLLGFSTSIEWFLRRIRCCQWRPGRLSLSSFWSP